MINDINPIARALAAGAMLSVFVLANASPAAAQATSSQTTQAAPQAAPMKKASPMRMSPDRVEARIKDLHGRLHITAAQETQWTVVAQAMRDNAKAIETIAAERKQKIDTMNAVDDLRSYESLAETHADGMKKLVGAFAPLYDSMSDSQKKTADALFRHHARHHQSAAKKS